MKYSDTLTVTHDGRTIVDPVKLLAKPHVQAILKRISKLVPKKP